MENTKTIKSTRVARTEVDGLYDYLKHQFLTTEELNQEYHLEIINDDFYNDVIHIDELIKTLQKFKEKGSDYIHVDYHVDHGSYIIEGYKLEAINNEEQNEINEYNIQIENLKLEMKKLEQEYRLKKTKLTQLTNEKNNL
jgi:exopolyphosphatase/pppGpp-phosphohydrolase